MRPTKKMEKLMLTSWSYYGSMDLTPLSGAHLEGVIISGDLQKQSDDKLNFTYYNEKNPKAYISAYDNRAKIIPEKKTSIFHSIHGMDIDVHYFTKLMCENYGVNKSFEVLEKNNFQIMLDKYQNRFTKFSVCGPNGQIVNIQIPYFISKNGIYGGKNSYEIIQDYIIEKYFNKTTNKWLGTSKQIESWIHALPSYEKKNFGIDCSGFAYFVLNEATKINEKDDMTTGALYKQFQSSYANGVSASSLTSKKNGIHITKAQDILIGTTICTDGGGHILVVFDVEKDSKGFVKTIHYAHSNGSKGPHTAYITIGDSSKDLADPLQTWHDSAYTDDQAKKYYDYAIFLHGLEPYR